MSGRATAYYDGACPLCAREIAFLRRRSGAGCLDWVDVSATSGERVSEDLTRADAMARFHVRTPDGRLVSGVPAFAEVWARLPALRPLGALARLPGVGGGLEHLYRAFLAVRPRLQRALTRVEGAGAAPLPRWLARASRALKRDPGQ